MNRIFEKLVSATLAPALAVTVAALLMITSSGVPPARGSDHAPFPRGPVYEKNPSQILVFETTRGSADARINFHARGAGSGRRDRMIVTGYLGGFP